MGYYCNKCEKGISPEEYKFSMKKYSRALCRNDQQSSDKISVKPRIRHRSPNKKTSTPTHEATKLAEALKKLGLKPELEKFDGYKHIDIAIVTAKVNIEVDGGHHNTSEKQALADLKRTYHSFKKGYVTLHIPNCLVKNDKTIEETAAFINKFVRESLDQLESEEDF